jgi:hypothetical protein
VRDAFHISSEGKYGCLYSAKTGEEDEDESLICFWLLHATSTQRGKNLIYSWHLLEVFISRLVSPNCA